MGEYKFRTPVALIVTLFVLIGKFKYIVYRKFLLYTVL